MRIILIFLLFSSARGIKLGCTMTNFTYSTLFIDYERTCMVTSIDYSDDPIRVTSATGTNLATVKMVDFGSINNNCPQLGLTIIPQGLEKVFPALKTLAFYNCSISSLSGSELNTYTNLEVFDMTYSNVEIVPSNLFSYNPKMKYVGFRSNRIKHIGSNLFSNLAYLQRVYFQNNICANSYAYNSSMCPSLFSMLKSKCPEPPCGTFVDYDVVNRVNDPEIYGFQGGVNFDGIKEFVGVGNNSNCDQGMTSGFILTKNNPGAYLPCHTLSFDKKTPKYLLYNSNLVFVPTNNTEIFKRSDVLLYNGSYAFGRVKYLNEYRMGKIHYDSRVNLYMVDQNGCEQWISSGYEVLTCKNGQTTTTSPPTTTTTLATTTTTKPTTTTIPTTTTTIPTTTTTTIPTTTVAPCISDTIPAGVTIMAPYTRVSCNGCFKLVLQTDGNLVIYQNPTNVVIWATYTQGLGVNRAIMQSDGNFVLYTAANVPIWYTGWTGTGTTGAVAKIQNDGQFVIMQGSNIMYSNGVTAECPVATTTTMATTTTTLATTTTLTPFDPNAFCSTLTTGYYDSSINSTCTALIYCYTSNSKPVGLIVIQCKNSGSTTLPPAPTPPPIDPNSFCGIHAPGIYAIDSNSTCTYLIYCVSAGSGTLIVDCSSPPFDANVWCSTMPIGLYPSPLVDGTCSSYVDCSNGGGVEMTCTSPTLFNPATKSCSSTFVCEM